MAEKKAKKTSRSATAGNDNSGIKTKTDIKKSSDEINSLVEAFEYFTETTEKLKESYDSLQEKISELDLELERKNRELYVNIREKDTIRNHLENILESMTLGVIVLNLDGEISIYNRAAAEILGHQPEDVLGLPYMDVLGLEQPEEQTPVHILHNGPEKNNKEKVVITKDGKEMPVEYSTSVVRNELGEALGVVEIFSDLREIKKLQEEVQHSRTLAALGEMASNVAHEIRNPLGGIGGFAALLERDLDVDDPRRKLVIKIIDGVARLNRIATNLLVYTRPVQPKKRPESITMLVTEVLTFVQVELEQDESSIKLKKRFYVKDLDIPVDPELFQQVLLNVAKNAVQAMGETGELLVTVKNIRKKEQVEIAVKDTGPGIPEDYIPKLFMPFFTTKADGTGLGLSIVKKMVDAHNGEITVDSSPEGTIFKILLPY